MKELPPSTQTGEVSDGHSGSGSTSANGPGQLVFENAPKRKRSVLDQYVLTSVERLSKQLIDFAHQQPELYLNRPVDGDVLVDRADATTSTPLGTALGALLLVPPPQVPLPQDIKPTNSESAYTMETTTSDLAGNDDDQGEPPAI
ncbi:hypothetical protein L2E82_24805 [Cichorium intybus]|uniref:Uncharacterized protein n=1 Tax=Cichorium intybus TaxID=13427 RepID=A0ACB9E1B2_CICIN|nr:hypothetical protein L2E82_24805 [Cichorium intybus]